MKKAVLLVILLFSLITNSFAQLGNDFWIAPPDITDLHNSPGGEPLYLLLVSGGASSTVTISLPANGSFVPIVVTVPANKSKRVNLTPFKAQLETRPTNTICNTGLWIQSSTPINAYYEIENTNNSEMFPLKATNAVGQEFYIPLHKHFFFNNEASFAAPHQAFASFDIVATQNGTTVSIFSPVPVDGHPAQQQFSITLNKGQTYSCGFTGTNWQQPSIHPSGATVTSDKPIVVNIKDDSDHNPSGGCYDLIGDQITPVNKLGTDYIAIKGSLNNTGDESVVLVATQNNTQVFLAGAATPVVTMFAGEYFRVDIDSLSSSANNAIYVHTTKPVYAMHITGFGCEMGMAQLPPVNCAGTKTINFMRDDAQTFYIMLACRTADVNNFSIVGPGTAIINPASFVTVPGTGGLWKAARIQYNTTQVPVDSAFKVTNTTGRFMLGILNGGASSGADYGYFSAYSAVDSAKAGPDMTRCANTTITLNGSIVGNTGATGIWSSSGTGTFLPNPTTLNAQYVPSNADVLAGTVTLTLTTTGACTPHQDQMVLTITPAPTVNANIDQTKCRNNPNVNLNGSVTVATGGTWTGGAGTFLPNNTSLNTLYVPTAGELAAGNVTLTLTTTGFGSCNPVNDQMTVFFTPTPTVNAGADQLKCSNNAVTQLVPSVTVATSGSWTGGAGSFFPSANVLNAIYTPTPVEINNGSVTLTLTSNAPTCNPVSDQMTITFTPQPTAYAGPDQNKCENDAQTLLAGSLTGSATGIWTSGAGTFIPNNTTLNATYTPTAGELSAGMVQLMLTTTDNDSCNPASDLVNIYFIAPPTVYAGADQTQCANDTTVHLGVSIVGATGGTWSGGNGSFSPSANSLNPVYIPTAGEMSSGSVTLTFASTASTCNSVTDQVNLFFTPAPSVDAGPSQTVCASDPDISLNGTATSCASFQWSGGVGIYSPNNNTLNAVYTPTPAEVSAGSITLTLTGIGNGTCGTVSDPVIVNFNPGIPFTITSTPGTTSCTGDTIVLQTPVPGNYVWYRNMTMIPGANTNTYQAVLSGGYQLEITDTNGCVVLSNVADLIFNSLPIPAITTPQGTGFCAGDSVLVVASGGNTYTWNDGHLNPVRYITIPGNYFVTVTDANTCTSVSGMVNITEFPIPTVIATSNNNICEGDSLHLNITGANTYEWNGPNGFYSTIADVLIDPVSINNDGYYIATGTSINGCEGFDTLQVNIFPSPSVSISASSDTLCINHGIVLLAGAPAGGIFTGTGVNNAIFEPLVAGAGNHTITYDYTDINGCSGSASLTIDVLGCLGIEDPTTGNFNLYPNPATSTITLSWNTSVQLKAIAMLDISGKMIFSKNISSQGNMMIDINQLPAGVYILQTIGDEERYIKWIKSN